MRMLSIEHSGLWLSGQEPTLNQCVALERLLLPGARLYVQERYKGRISAFVANQDGLDRTSYVMVDVYSLIQRRFVAFHEQPDEGTKVYVLTDLGQEAIAQFRAWEALKARGAALHKRELIKQRKIAAQKAAKGT